MDFLNSFRPPMFLSSFWKNLFELQGSILSFISANHPMSDGKIEALNKCLETYLCCYIGSKQKQWSKWLPLAEYSYNNSYHTSTKISHFEALYGYPPPCLLSYVTRYFIYRCYESTPTNKRIDKGAVKGKSRMGSKLNEIFCRLEENRKEL
ncbi:hypothetical protein I3760_05G187700 [Carya illinoinensis]|nr:hypothetical protein I3760_05G187700 [Carya illinoinensis]